MKNLLAAMLLHDTFWAIEVGAGNLLLQQLRTTDAERHLVDYQASQKDVEARSPGASGSYADDYGDVDDGIAQIKLSGTMTKKGSSYSDGGTIALRKQLRSAANDAAVKGIMLVIDSPGGTVAGTNDLGNEVAAASKKKLLTAYVEDQCCSAAYWTASQAAGGIYGNTTCMVGSIGTLMVAYDTSRMYENAGIEALVFATGILKGAGMDGAKITPEQRASFQKTVDDLNDHFLGAVAKGRNMERARVEKLADGGVLIGGAAKKAGLIDGISSADEVMQSMKQRVTGKSKSFAGASYPDNVLGLSEPLPVGASLEDSLEMVHAAVLEVTGRVRSVQSMRADQGRKLSAERVSQVRTLAGSLGDLTRECEGISLPAEPSSEGSDAPAAAAESAVATSIDPSVLAELTSLLDD